MDEYHKLLDAIKLAWEVHEGQYRHDGVTPYIVHPLTVMLHVDSYKVKIVAVLHDTLEDNATGYGLSNRILNMFGEEIHDAVLTLTKRSKHSYEEYIDRVCENKLAREVKYFDIKHNLSTRPKGFMKDKQHKWEAALERLSFKGMPLK
jgi:(p)ppGpp synthase/HD superfamily hydrolase